ncbi:hypothetical protein PCE1_001285 [Barthelona sp. PCE]
MSQPQYTNAHSHEADLHKKRTISQNPSKVQAVEAVPLLSDPITHIQQPSMANSNSQHIGNHQPHNSSMPKPGPQMYYSNGAPIVSMFSRPVPQKIEKDITDLLEEYKPVLLAIEQKKRKKEIKQDRLSLNLGEESNEDSVNMTFSEAFKLHKEKYLEFVTEMQEFVDDTGVRQANKFVWNVPGVNQITPDFLYLHQIADQLPDAKNFKSFVDMNNPIIQQLFYAWTLQQMAFQRIYVKFINSGLSPFQFFSELNAGLLEVKPKRRRGRPSKKYKPKH